MQLLATIASILGIEVNALVARLRKNAVAWMAIGLFALVGLAFLLVGLHAALAAWLGPVWAPLAIGGGALLVALALFAVLRVTESIAAREQARRRRAAETTALTTSAALTALPLVLKSPLMRNVGIPLGGALAALYLMGRAPRGGGDES